MRIDKCVALSAIIAISGCTSTSKHNAEEQTTPAVIERYDLDITSYPALDSATRADFREKYATVNNIMLHLYTATNGTSAIYNEGNIDSLLSDYARSKGIDMFGCAIRDRLTPLDSIERELGKMRDRVNNIIPKLKWPRLYGIISTYDQAIILDGDSIALIGLNHYLGSGDEAYANFDQYIRNSKNIEALPEQLAEALLSSQAPYSIDSNDATALSKMLYSGALIWITKKINGDTDISRLSGWTEQQSKWAQDNKLQAWNALINRKLLYSTDPDVAMRLIKNAPTTSILHPDAPGQMGTWMGLQIVDAYMKRHPETSAWTLLHKTFYGNINSLIESGYDVAGSIH